MRINMLTIYLDEHAKKPLYMQLYDHVRQAIIEGRVEAHEKLPSKRRLAAHLKVSTLTVEQAYQQLIVEGYVYAIEKKGYFVEPYIAPEIKPVRRLKTHHEARVSAPAPTLAFKTNVVDTDLFPNQTWAKLAREVLSENHHEMLNVTHPQGLPLLREEIARHLARYRGIDADPARIIIGSGSESLLAMIVQIIGRRSHYAMEDPGYPKIHDLLKGNDVKLTLIPLDESGLRLDALMQANADVVHITPSHQFPSGIVMPIKRRNELLNWSYLEPQRHIIEDDYDSEFRFQGKPIPALLGLDEQDKVIYMNTFTKSLAPSFRISYLVLPAHLMPRYREVSVYHSCSVPNFEQYILYKFMKGSYFERHISRMRKAYKFKLDLIISAFQPAVDAGEIRIMGADAGLHFTIKDLRGFDERTLVDRAAEEGVQVTGMSRYRHRSEKVGSDHATLVIGYSGLSTKALEQGLEALSKAWYLTRSDKA
ncbi:MAG: PLP-dependent aminotransferase family protein [Acholeplasmataceae bacterium]|nr:MAG: PLP-dependent aminotransferase family protein [Acholeplasmataceae bacterium]